MTSTKDWEKGFITGDNFFWKVNVPGLGSNKVRVAAEAWVDNGERDGRDKSRDN